MLIYEKCILCGEIIKGHGRYSNVRADIQYAREKHLDEKHRDALKTIEEHNKRYEQEIAPFWEEWEAKKKEISKKYPHRGLFSFFESKERSR